MNRILSICVLSLCVTATAVDLPEEARVANRGPMCAWASLESLGNLHRVDALHGVRDYRYANKRGEQAFDPVIKAELDRRGVRYRMTRSLSYDRSLLESYASSHGAMVSFKAGTWSSMCHAVVITHYDGETVKFYCSDVRTKQGKPHIWTCKKAWFDWAWLGNAVVILPDDQDSHLAQN